MKRTLDLLWIHTLDAIIRRLDAIQVRNEEED